MTSALLGDLHLVTGSKLTRGPLKTAKDSRGFTTVWNTKSSSRILQPRKKVRSYKQLVWTLKKVWQKGKSIFLIPKGIAHVLSIGPALCQRPISTHYDTSVSYMNIMIVCSHWNSKAKIRPYPSLGVYHYTNYKILFVWIQELISLKYRIFQIKLATGLSRMVFPG